MAGTREGGKKAAMTNKTRYGADFYKRLGQRGGKNGHTGGFYARRDLAKKAGAIGGRRSRRGNALDGRTLDEIRRYLVEYPELSYKEIAEACGVGVWHVGRIVREEARDER